MAIITLTFTGSEEEIVSGVPRTMTITSNAPSTIYFTVDGATPTIDSPIYISTFSFPTGMNSVILSAFGVDSLDISGPILTQTYATDSSGITVSRHVNLEGIIIDRTGVGLDIEDGFGADGDAVRLLDIPLVDLEIVYEAAGYSGIGEGTQTEVNIPDPESTPYPFDNDFQLVSTPEIGELFNPYARTILIDDRKDNDLRIIPRPYGSLHNIYREFGGKRLLSAADDAAYVSGGFVRRFYNAKNGVMTGYYYDHNENRHIKNIQSLPDNIPNTTSSAVFGQPLVFRWLARGQISGLI